jgi:nucleoside-diphosphate-sugar epimerase
MTEAQGLTQPDYWSGKRVAVGGGCGFLGSYLVPELVRLGARVTVVDNLENGYLENLATVSSEIEMVTADLRERPVCDRVTRGQDVFLNLAAKAFGMEYSRTHHAEMLVDNLMAGLLPLAAACHNHVGRFMVVSSSCVYPDDVEVPTAEGTGFVGSPEIVNEGYGWAKRMQEQAATYYARDHGMQITVVRPFNMYGGNYRWKAAEKAHVVPTLVKRVLDGEDPLVVWGSGQQRRNLLHGRDAAHVILKVVERSTDARPVNIGYEDDTPIAELVDVICEVTGRRPRVIFDRAKPEGAFRKCADATRLRSLTGGYEPRVSLREGIADMVTWYQRSFGSGR